MHYQVVKILKCQMFWKFWNWRNFTKLDFENFECDSCSYLSALCLSMLSSERRYWLYHTGSCRINWTIQTFNQVCENLHKITTLTPIVYEQVKYKFLYSSVINILCDVISDIVGNMKTRQLTSASSCARICGTRKVATELPRLKPSRLFHLGEHSNSLFTVIVVFETLSTRKKSCKPAGSRLVKTLSIAL